MKDGSCPHCLVVAMIEGLLEAGVDPHEIAHNILLGLQEGLSEYDVVIITNQDQPNFNVTIH